MDYKENVQEFLVSNTECSTNTTVQLREKLHSQEPSPFPKKCQSLKVFSLVIFSFLFSFWVIKKPGLGVGIVRARSSTYAGRA